MWKWEFKSNNSSPLYGGNYFSPRPLYSRKESAPRHHLFGGGVGPQIWFENFGEEKNLEPLTEMKQISVGRPNPCGGSVPTELPSFLIINS